MRFKKPSDISIRHISILLVTLLISKLLLVLLVILVPFDSILSEFIPPEVQFHNRRVLGIDDPQYPLLRKLSYSWDSIHYIKIAEGGYRYYDGSEYPDSMRVFNGMTQCLHSHLFMYPLLIRFLSLFTDLLVASLLVSNTASLASLVLFYVAASKYVGNDSAFKSSLLFLFYPSNMVHGMVSYSDSLFTALIIGAWLLFDGKRYFLAGFTSLIASFTRYPGALLFPIFSVLCLLRSRRGKNRMAVLNQLIVLNLFSIPLLYWLFVQIPSDTGRSLSEIELMCHGNSVGIPGSFILSTSALNAYFLYFFFLGLYCLKDVDKSLMIYSGVFLVLYASLEGNAVVSIGRYVGTIWPIYLYYGKKIDSITLYFLSMVMLVISFIMLELFVNYITII
ncbi:MAG: hypothetical protein ABIH11_00395 [Candidatus Altiarchaeota archaeon]